MPFEDQIPGSEISENSSLRERSRHYIPAADSELKRMMEKVGVSGLADLYRHIPESQRFVDAPGIPEELDGKATRTEMQRLADANRKVLSLIGDGLPDYSTHSVVDVVSSNRKLATAYTPYQPERSQGTLITQWIYQCMMAELTGFEAINASLYDRATAVFEAILTSLRLKKDGERVIACSTLYPGDVEVVKTHLMHTDHLVDWVGYDPASGLTDFAAVKSLLEKHSGKVAAVVFPQVNGLGLLEPVDDWCDLAQSHGAKAIAVVDPVLIGPGGLKPPSEYGSKGADIVVGEAQHLAVRPTFGGPGLGLFGVRMNGDAANDVRSTPGRYVGKAKDGEGRDCFVAVMSAREQHIRRDKATSNICSNQAFMASLAGAAVLARGTRGMGELVSRALNHARKGAALFTSFDGIDLAFPKQVFANEVTLRMKDSAREWIARGLLAGIHLGVDVSDRIAGSNGNLLKVSFHDEEPDWTKIEALLSENAARRSHPACGADAWRIPESALRRSAVCLPEVDEAEIVRYYKRLGDLNISPDEAIYPLGSCTMKYNPMINEWSAGLEGFLRVHPQAPSESAQGCLEVLYETQEWFKGITGLAGVTTQPVAGAQGELVGLKLIQAYHDHNGQGHRDVVLLPQTAHGTNFASAAVAGYVAGRCGRPDAGIVVLKTDRTGGVDMADFDDKMTRFGDRLAAVMITNPNTCGIFESHFRAIADRVHAAGGLVYMDGANMNAIAGWVNLAELGVDAVHNNLHKTWSIPHGGGGPGDGMVAVSERLVDYLPGMQIEKKDGCFVPVKAPLSIGSFHRHWGNFGHKLRCLTYLKRLGREGVRRMSAVSVLAARYVFERLRGDFSALPSGSDETPRMHEFIVTLAPDDLVQVLQSGIAKTAVMSGIGKLFLDFGYHAPTIAWPEPMGMMAEPTESYTLAELDRFCDAALTILRLVREKPSLLATAPHFTPIGKVNEVEANRAPVLSERMPALPVLHRNRIEPGDLLGMDCDRIADRLLALQR